MNLMDEYQFKALKHRSKENQITKTEWGHTEDTSIGSSSQRRILSNTPEQEPRNSEHLFSDPREDGLPTTSK